MSSRMNHSWGILLLVSLAICWQAFSSAQLHAQKKKVYSAGIKANNRNDKDQGPKMDVAKVDSMQAENVKKSAARIDELIEAHLQYLRMEPNPMTNDAQFVRRVHLDITGTIPTYEDAKAFIESTEPNKRAKLIDDLLNSPGYVSHSYNFWANILRLTDRPNNNVIGECYLEWIKDSLSKNTPYDKWVHEMLTAEGKIWDNPAVGYTLRDAGMPLDAMNNTVRVFLGTQIGCAQCHDHPFDKWTQRDFYEIAAYTFGTQTRRGGFNLGKLREELKKIDPKNRGGGTFARLVNANSFEVWENKNQQLKLPHDYAYEDGKPGDHVEPSPIFGDAGQLKKDDSRREIFAKWLTSPNNPRFAGTIANRLWKRVMGAGLLEPEDDIQDESTPENRPLMGLLVSEMIRLKFDQKEFLRILYNTRTYQRQASLTENPDGQVYHFPGPTLRRMSAEQVWDSILTLAIYNPDAIQRPTMKGMSQVASLNPKTVNAKLVQQRADEFDEKFGNKAMAEMRRDTYYKGLTLARASELPQPLPPDHFLRQFGQGDRELISGASSDGTVPQILAMFNGPVTHMMLEKGSVIFDNVVNTPGVARQIEVIFLSVLARKPTAEEKGICYDEIKREKAAGYGNVIWALLNTREFLFIQ